MKKVAIFLALILLGLKVPGQINKYGIPLFKSYSAEDINGSDYTNSIIKDNLGYVYLANEDIGIIRYDGNNWRTIPVRNNQLIRAFGKDNNGTIYAGGKYEFGYLEPDDYGTMTYISLSQRLDIADYESLSGSDTNKVKSEKKKINIGEIYSVAVKDSSVVFVSDEALFEYNIANDTLKYLNLRTYGLKNVLKVFIVGEKVILGDNTSGLWEYKEGEVKMLSGSDFFNLKRCMLILPYDNATALVATLEYGVYLFNYETGEVKKDFIDTSLQKLFTESFIYSGCMLPSGEFALGTWYKGVFILDHNGHVRQHWDKNNSGLLDNGGVLAIYYDSSADYELWISTVGYVSKVYINLPYTEFSSKSGINGGVDCVCEMDGIIYVSTDLGVYKSRTNIQGQVEFTKIPEIMYQVFPLVKASVGKEVFILAGSINGLFRINRNGKVTKIFDEAPGLTQKEKKLELYVRNIVQSEYNPERFYVGCNTEGVYAIDYNSGKWTTKHIYKTGQGMVVGVSEVSNGDLIIGTDFSNNVYHVSADSEVPQLYGADKGVPDATVNAVGKIGNEIILSTVQGLYKYLVVNDSWVPFNEITGNFTAGKESLLTFQDYDNDFWLAYKDKRFSERLFKTSDGRINSYSGPLALLPNVKLMDIKDIDNKIWMAISGSVYVVDKEKLLSATPAITPLLSKIVVGRDSIVMDGSFHKKGVYGKKISVPEQSVEKIPELRFNLNSVSFFWSTPYYINEEVTIYSYKLDGFDSDWSQWEKVIYKDYTNLPYGHYFFRVKALTATEIETSEAVYEFSILKPWYLTAVMIVIYILALILIIFAIIKAYTKKLKNENIRLEGIVAERTAVVVKQKEELESSIHYASRIQMALLPSEAVLKENIGNYFVLFRPRDIVSGDFYWMIKKGERLYIVAADCTGHGVPGAFMSLLGMSFLDEIIDKELAPRADIVLKELRLHVTESLKQVGGDDEAKDGMDMAILVIDYATQRIEYSGAYNPCFRVRKLTETEIKNFHEDDSAEMPDGSMSNGNYLLETIYASKMPIGISSRMDEEFVFHNWDIEKGISYYMFSDGYIDQFGGPHGRKFMKKSFKRLILDIQDHPMNEQKELLDKNLMEWRGHSPQIDDILVMGIRIE